MNTGSQRTTVFAADGAALMRRRSIGDRHWRSLAKATTWRITGSVDTFLVGWLITGKPTIAGSIAVVEVVTKIGLYYLHERAWDWVPCGKAQMKHTTEQK